MVFTPNVNNFTLRIVQNKNKSELLNSKTCNYIQSDTYIEIIKNTTICLQVKGQCGLDSTFTIEQQPTYFEM